MDGLIEVMLERGEPIPESDAPAVGAEFAPPVEFRDLGDRHGRYEYVRRRFIAAEILTSRFSVDM